MIMERTEAQKVDAKAAKKEKAAKAKQEALQTQVQKAEINYPIRGNVFEGKVTSAKASKTVTVERILTHYIPKYERYLKIRSKIKAHNPTSINAKEGDLVRIGETRKISKTKSFVVMEILNKGEKKE